MTAWHQLDVATVAQRLGTDVADGLTQSEAERRVAEHGPNELVERGARRAAAILWDQLTGTMVIVLLVAAVVSAALGDLMDAIAIAAIVVLNALLGFVQEYRAEKAMAALKQLAMPRVTVRRDGQVREIAARDLVPGDLILLKAGDLVMADARVVSGAGLRTQEAALTGESAPIEKTTAPLETAELGIGDRRNMVFMGTVVAYGRGGAIATETGMRTELGAIATALQSIRHEPTPLQRRLDHLGRQLAVAAFIIVCIIFGLGVLGGEEVRLMFLTAVSMAVAAVPEGLPAVVTIALALGAQRMLKRRALIRKLAAVETLGSVTTICSDKTGTLTENRMRTARIDVGGRQFDFESGNLPDPQSEVDVALLMTGLALCNDATPDAVGDPTEVALVAAAAQLGLEKGALERQFPRVVEVAFDSDRKRMTTIHTLPGASSALERVFHQTWKGGGEARHVAFSKGAIDGLLDICTRVWAEGEAKPRDDSSTKQILATHDRLAEDGMRVLGLGFRPLGRAPAADDAERDLVFVGVVGMIDPPRAEVQRAVATCAAAGIRPTMITGDHPLTARYIARKLGIDDGGRLLTGAELERLSQEELASRVDEVRVYARVSPQHKYRIVDALQRRGHIVAMTGDGVNDAPALQKADIGVAMGIMGTDVAKEAADAVLLDDNFATIVAAVEEGRIIYDNIRKFVKYLLTTNSGELWLMLVAPLVGMPLPLLPLQILWINLVTDGPTALTLGVEPAERGVMQRPPRPPGESIFAEGLGVHVFWVGMLMAALTLGVGYWYWRAADVRWQTMVFTTLALAQMAHVLAIRANTDSLFQIGLLSNRLLAAAVAGTIGLQLALVYVAPLQAIFSTRWLALGDVAISVGAASILFAAVEVEKWVYRARLASPPYSPKST